MIIFLMFVLYALPFYFILYKFNVLERLLFSLALGVVVVPFVIFYVGLLFGSMLSGIIIGYLACLGACLSGRMLCVRYWK